MINIKSEIKNFEKEKNQYVKKEIADSIIEEVNLLLKQMDNLENKAQHEVTGDITYKETTDEMQAFITENSQSIEEELENIMSEIQGVSDSQGYFNELIKYLEDLLIDSKY
ncbi:MAG: hypothetical protein ACRCZ2_00050 [Fusobacteriaceae bacterium]